ncbi:kinase-like domain-containing protein, partial [Mycena olivaceomarginata]
GDWKLLDYDPNLVTANRRKLFKALIKLSAGSKLYPRWRVDPLVMFMQDCFKVKTSAVKMMRVFGQSDIDTLLKEFGREALIWRQLSHPNLLPFYGLYYYKERLCLISPWMENGHIRLFLKKKSYCSDCLLSLILDVALGLEHLHTIGVVHGDLKGENIFVTPSHRACIADFGLSSIITSISSIQSTRSSGNSQGGTARYQAPELHRGGHNDQQTDIYGLACVVYELLTGTAPFPELHTDIAVAMAVLAGRRPSCPLSCTGTPSLDSLWNLLQKCWDEHPQNRPTASQLVQSLMGDAIQAQKVESVPDWDERSTSRFRRHLNLHNQPLPSVDEFERMIFGDGRIGVDSGTAAADD